MKRFLLNTLFGIYVVVAVFVTICLLEYNNYNVTEFGDYSLVIIPNEEEVSEFKKGDLILVNKKGKIDVGQKVFFYNTYNAKIEISLATVTDIEKVTNTESTYTLENERKISSQYVLGPTSPVTVVKGVGGVLKILESKWGFLFIIVLPALLAFIYQIGVVISEIKNSRE